MSILNSIQLLHLPHLERLLSLVSETATFSPLRQVDPGLCALKMAASCSRFFARVVLKIPFSSSHSKGSRCKRLVSLLAKSALMLSTGVTLD